MHQITVVMPLVVSDAFAVSGKPPEAVRLCLDGPAARAWATPCT